MYFQEAFYLKILIVDDNSDITRMFWKYLTVKGYECVISNNGVNGLNLIKNQSFDYVILDMTMPDFGGHDIIESLEKEDSLKNKKIVILTATSMSNMEIEHLTKKIGIASFLKKPVQPSELLQILSNGV
jgi:DNA-binding response OmpR family regulator